MGTRLGRVTGTPSSHRRMIAELVLARWSIPQHISNVCFRNVNYVVRKL